MIRFLRLVKVGAQSIRLHLLRSILTALGIIIGVSAVIFMLAIVEGSAQAAQDRIRARGATNIILKAKKPQDDQSAQTSRSRMVTYGLTYADIARIHASFKDVEVCVPVRKVNNSFYPDEGTARVDSAAMGTVPWYADVAKIRMDRGRWIHHIEAQQASAVAVLGATLAERLFDYRDPIGRSIRIGSKPFRVIGVMKPVLTDDPEDALAQDGGAFVPITTVRERFGERNVKRSSGNMEIEQVELHQVLVKVNSIDAVRAVASGIEDILEDTHRKEDYELVVPLKLLDQAEEQADESRWMFGSIAAVSLLVGGIGIANIMLASVTERTREIGVRRALGAKKGDITIQFLMEALILAVSGCIAGVAIGLSSTYGYAFNTGQPAIVTWKSILWSFSVSTLVGILAGLYPAIRAAQMDPIRALRHE